MVEPTPTPYGPAGKPVARVVCTVPGWKAGVGAGGGVRPGDAVLLARHFVTRYANELNPQVKGLAADAAAAIDTWPWPGNVRELENLMERSVILSQGSALRVPLSELREPVNKVVSSESHTLGAAEREHIIRVLRETRGLISGPDGAAHRLGLKRTTLQSKRQRLQIKRSDYT